MLEVLNIFPKAIMALIVKHANKAKGLSSRSLKIVMLGGVRRAR
jgi:hypothetical protein